MREFNVGMLNKIIHEYFDVDYEIVWKVIKEKIPELYVIVQKIIEEVNKNGYTAGKEAHS